MKQLLLIRHGKSELGNAYLSDFDRPLNERGHRDAPEMALRIFQKDLIPQVVISSPALRAFTTASHFKQAWYRDTNQIKLETLIYEATIQDLLVVVNTIDNKYQRVALFGHNPGFTDFANYLSEADIYNIPTCGVVLIEFPVDDWRQIGNGSGTLVDFDYPKSSGDD